MVPQRALGAQTERTLAAAGAGTFVRLRPC